MPRESTTPGAVTFAAGVTCIDGRCHEPLVTWVRQRFGVDHVDLVTRPGADGTLSTCPGTTCEDLHSALEVSVGAHDARVIVVAGHDDCAAHPVSEQEHRRDIDRSVAQIESWQLGPAVLGVWIDEQGEVSELTAQSNSGAPARLRRAGQPDVGRSVGSRAHLQLDS